MRFKRFLVRGQRSFLCYTHLRKMFAAVRETVSKHINRVMFHYRAAQICSSALILMVAASSLVAQTAQQSGYVRTGETPIASSAVTLYNAGDLQNTAPTILGKATTGATGFSSIPFNPPSDTGAVLYLIADGGSVLTAQHGHSPLAGVVRLATSWALRPSSLEW